MADFHLKIAGHTATVTSLFESTPQYLKAYLTEEEPEFTITVTRENIAFEQADLLEEAHRDGFKPRVFTDPFLERAAIQRAFAEFLFDRNTLLVHGSTIAVDGKAYLFAARSGTGKSTHTRLWREVFGNRAVMINDDKPFLQLTDAGVIAFGSPWSGKHGLDTNISAPLAGICILERGSENLIRPIPAEEALPMLQKQTYFPSDTAKHAITPEKIRMLADRVPLWHMACTKDPQAAIIAHDAMGK